MQKEKLSQKCDKPNMALSQIWDKTNSLRDWIISHLGLGHLRWRRRANFGLLVLYLFKFLCGSNKRRKRRSEEKEKFGSSQEDQG